MLSSRDKVPVSYPLFYTKTCFFHVHRNRTFGFTRGQERGTTNYSTDDDNLLDTVTDGDRVRYLDGDGTEVSRSEDTGHAQGKFKYM